SAASGDAQRSGGQDRPCRLREVRNDRGRAHDTELFRESPLQGCRRLDLVVAVGPIVDARYPQRIRLADVRSGNEADQEEDDGEGARTSGPTMDATKDPIQRHGGSPRRTVETVTPTLGRTGVLVKRPIVQIR